MIETKFVLRPASLYPRPMRAKASPSIFPSRPQGCVNRCLLVAIGGYDIVEAGESSALQVD